MKRALIVDVAGGDGAYLARLLQARGYEVWGSVPDLETADFGALDDLGVRETMTLRALTFVDASEVAALLAEARADEIYDLTGASGAEPGAIVTANAMLLEALPQAARFFNAGTSEAFGDSGSGADETTAMQPTTDTGRAAAQAAQAVVAARAAGSFAVTGLQFDHASRFGPRHGLAQHIIDQVLGVAAGTTDAVYLSQPDLPRDWGWTPEYVDAMWRMLQSAQPQDYVLATGKAMTPREFAGFAFDYFKVTDRQVITSAEPTRHATGIGNPARAQAELGWRSYTFGEDLVQTLCEGFAAPGIGPQTRA